MNVLSNRCVAMFLVLTMAFTMIPYNFKVQETKSFQNKQTETKNSNEKIEYEVISYGKNPSADCGAIVAPKKSGTYRVIIVQHGDYSYDAVAGNMKKCMEKWVNEGLIEPMIVVTPYVIQANGYNSHENFAKVQLPLVVDRINNGTFENMISCKIDKTKKIALSGYSLGGAVTAYAGMKYKDTFPFLGVISPSPFGLYPGGVWKDWISNDPDTADYNLNTDSDHLFMMFSGSQEPKYDDVKNVYYNEFGEAAKFTNVTWKDGVHRLDYFSQSVFYFMYTLQNGKEPTDNELSKAKVSGWNTTITRTVVRPGDNVSKTPINGTLEFAKNPQGKVDYKYGFSLRASVKNCNAKDSTCGEESRTPYSYKWKRDNDYIKGERKDYYTLCPEDIGHRITCEVSSITGKYSGYLSVTSDPIEKAYGPAAPSGLTSEPCSKGGSDGKIINTTDKMEYATKSDFSDAKPCNGSVVSGLKKGTYLVRIKSTDTHCSGGVATVTVTESDKAKAEEKTEAPTTEEKTEAPTTEAKTEAPTTEATTEAVNSITGTIKFGGEFRYEFCVSAKVEDSNASAFAYQWYRDDKPIKNAVYKDYLCQAEDIGCKLTCVVTDKDGKLIGSISASSEAAVKKSYGSVAPKGVVGVDSTAKGAKDGKITGVSKDMEYATKTDFSDKKICEGTEITDLSAGIYYVRYSATDTSNASQMCEIAIK